MTHQFKLIVVFVQYIHNKRKLLPVETDDWLDEEIFHIVGVPKSC